MNGNSKIVGKPSLAPRQANEDQLDQFVRKAPDVQPAAAPASAPAATDPVPVIARRGRKEPISLTLQADMIAKLDRARAQMGGLSRPAFIALAVTKFIEQNGG